MKNRLIISFFGISMFIFIGVLLPMGTFAQDAYEKAYALSKEDCKKISERLGEQITGGSQSIDDNLKVFGFGCEFTNNYRKGHWGGYASKLFEDIRIAIVEINFRRYDTTKVARNDVRNMMEADSKNKTNRTDILFTVRETPDGYSAVLKDPTDILLRGFQTTYSGTVKIVRGSCLMSVTGKSFVEDDGTYRYHEYDIKKEKLIDKHPGFNHDREAEMLALARAKAEEIFSVLDCGNDISSPSNTTPSVENSFSKSNSLNKSNYTQALVIEPPKESDFKKVKPSDFKKVNPVSTASAALKSATPSSNIKDTIFLGKVGGEGKIIIDLPGGDKVTLTDDQTAFDGKISIWRFIRDFNQSPMSNSPFQARVIMRDCHLDIRPANEYRWASDWSTDRIISTGNCDYTVSGDPTRILVDAGKTNFKTSSGVDIAVGKADFGISDDVVLGQSAVEIYNGSVTVKNKSGQAKTISSVYGSEIKQIEVDKNGVMVEKIAIPQSQWEAFLASQQEKEIVSRGNLLPIVFAITLLGAGGIIFFLYRKGKLIPLYKTLGQKVSVMKKKISKNSKQQD